MRTNQSAGGELVLTPSPTGPLVGTGRGARGSVSCRPIQGPYTSLDCFPSSVQGIAKRYKSRSRPVNMCELVVIAGMGWAAGSSRPHSAAKQLSLQLTVEIKRSAAA